MHVNFRDSTVSSNNKKRVGYQVEYTGCHAVLGGTTILYRGNAAILSRYKYYRVVYGTFWYRDTTSTAVLPHGSSSGQQN